MRNIFYNLSVMFLRTNKNIINLLKSTGKTL
jgi:hypothetical protein